jgi:hypothetical protein
MLLRALKQLMLQGAVRVVIAAVATACVTGFLILVANSFQPKKQSVAEAVAPNGTCMPSHCRSKTAIAQPKH